MSQAFAALRPFEIPGIAVFRPGAGDLIRLMVTSPLAEAHVYLQGAHVTHFQPAGAEPVLFLSKHSIFAEGKAIRGGVPVCFPWFGPRPAAPQHGFARTSAWEVESLTIDGDQVVTVALRLASSPATLAQWPHEFILRHHITIGRRLMMTLEVENTSSAPFVFENALHTYLQVGDVRQTATTGLENTAYLDKTDAQVRKTRGPEPIRITAETDWMFEHTRTSCVLEDPSLRRRITVDKSGSSTTVVWNPWIAKSAALLDFGADEWTRMLCLETVNAGADQLTLAPGKKHTLRAVISLG